MVGRVAELTRLEAVVDACRRGERAVAVVGGEAGIGKTRLVTELAERAREVGMEVLVGGCLDLDVGGIPYAPVVEALRDLFARLPEEEVADLLGGDAANLGLAAGRAVETGALEGQSSTLQAVQRTLERLARRRPVVLVVEDVHWADRSTRDLIAYLAAAGGASPIALVVTYRSEDVRAGHPLRGFVAELERRPHVVHVRLTRLGRADASRLLAALLGHAPDPSVSEAIYQRSEGNPFFVEELARAVSGPGAELPPLLRDVMAARVEQLSRDTQLVLRVAAVGGRRVEHERLAAVAPLTDAALTDAVREARDANVITADPAAGRYEFRHALLQEAVYADVLPGERRRYHAAYAEHLAARADESGIVHWAELAHHWRGAEDRDAALVATMHAGLAAEAGYALPEAYYFYNTALELSDAVDRFPPDAPLTRAELLARAADAASRTGAFARAVELASVAIDETDAAREPAAAGLLHERRAWFLMRTGAEERALAEYQEAVRLVPAEPPTEARARVLAAYADALLRTGEPDGARLHAEDAVRIGVEVGAPFDEGHARHMLGLALGAQGDTDGAIAELHRARVLAERNGDVADVAGTYVHLWRVLAEQGRADEMVALAREAAEFCHAAGLQVAAQLLDCVGSGFLHQLGRWDEAVALLPNDDDVWGLTAVVTHVLRGAVAVDRGDLADAREHLEAARGLGVHIYDGRIDGLLYRALAELALWEDRVEEARDAVVEGIARTGDDEMQARLCALGLRAAAEAAQRDRRAGSAPRAWPVAETAQLELILDRLDTRALARHAPAGSEVRAAAATGRAERGRVEGRADPDGWAEAVARWDALGFPAPAAYCRWQHAVAVLATGRRAEAVPLWREAHVAAMAIGAGPLQAAIEAEAADAALDLVGDGDGEDAAPRPFNLTDRELEVLTLVASGRTNRQIGEALFISEKTASVHVSRILAKLGASSRAQAAARAAQLGLARE
jgi:DNA-binding CsgD family transcriptional regulator/tetratricopeptide (TPR) repeat protein